MLGVAVEEIGGCHLHDAAQEFLRAVGPRLALPVHDAVASDLGRPIYLRQATNLAPEGTEVRDWPEDGVVEVARS